MTDLDNFKAMLSKVGIKFEEYHDQEINEIDIEFKLDWMPEELIFSFDTNGEIQEIV